MAPEIYQLAKEWDTLPSTTRGELAGYAVGKYGTDILVPGALAKVISKGLKSAQELNAIYTLRTAKNATIPFVKNWNPLTGSGPLDLRVANSFRSATYVEHTLEKSLILYRAYSDPSRALGKYWSRTPISGNIQAVIERIPKTQVSDTIGWKVGEPYNNRTLKGFEPKWTTVRQRYWKNRAISHPEEYGTANVERMKRGLAPQRPNPLTQEIESMELHHNPAQKNGGRYDFTELWPDEHAAIDPKRCTGR